MCCEMMAYQPGDPLQGPPHERPLSVDIGRPLSVDICDVINLLDTRTMSYNYLYNLTCR